MAFTIDIIDGVTILAKPIINFSQRHKCNIMIAVHFTGEVISTYMYVAGRQGVLVTKMGEHVHA